MIDVDKALSFCALSSTVIRRAVFLCASGSFNQVHTGRRLIFYFSAL
jgi:hypothetical protein